MAPNARTRMQRWWRQIRRFRVQRAHLPGLALLGAVLLATAITMHRPTLRSADETPARTVTAVKIGGPFRLIGPNGEAMTQDSFPGKYLLVFFGYTYCPDVCPTTLSNVADAMQSLGPLADGLQPLFITVDPQRDTPQVMKDYVAHFDTRIVPLTGSADAIAAAEKAYRVYAAPYRTGEDPDSYLMDHSAVLYLMDPQGAFVTTLDFSSSGSDMAEALKPYLKSSLSRSAS